MRRIKLDMKELKRLYESGLSQNKIAKEVGVCKRTIFRRFKEINYKCRINPQYKHGLMSKKLSSKELMINKRKLYPKQVKARELLSCYIKKNKVIKPNICSVCEKYFEDKRKIHGHHEDYNQPLKVVWCCSKCHSELDG